MAPSPSWFSARPNDSYPDSDGDDELQLFRPYMSAQPSRPPSRFAFLKNFSSKRRLGVLVLIAALPLLYILLRAALRRYELRHIPPGLYSSAGVLYAGIDPFHIKGISWYGMEGPEHCFEGLDKNNLGSILNVLRTHGFNAIRVPIALDNFIRDPVVQGSSISTFANAELNILSYRELLKVFVRRAAEKEILVLLDLHRLEAKVWPTDGLWYSKKTNEEMVISVWERLAKDFRNEWNVIGADLFNEPHGAPDWQQWRSFAERAGNRILALAPKWAIFIEGVGNLPGSPRPLPVFWAENLAEAAADPPVLSSPHKAVLSPHVYGPSVHNHTYFGADSSFPDNMRAIWEDHFGGSTNSGAAVVVGEFGGRNVGADETWHETITGYIRSKGFGSFYWCVNPSSGDTGGFLLEDWKTIDEEKARQLHALPSSSVRDRIDHFKRNS